MKYLNTINYVLKIWQCIDIRISEILLDETWISVCFIDTHFLIRIISLEYENDKNEIRMMLKESLK